ncbi:MAG TPA: M48 family metalloprotease [Tepidisphaeraceae bacterium]|nr:M48 family metalloprotease [Tepidisphaeraceae bacterium]
MKTNRRRLVVAGTITAALLMLALAPLNMGGCSASTIGDAVGNAVGGKQGQLIQATGKGVTALALSETQEDAMGQSVAVAITNRFGLDPNEALNKYVSLVGKTVAAASPRGDVEFHFGVLNTDEVNAYAGPNGYIMIARGALMRMQDESELAGVLAHEIAHVVDQHGLNMMKVAGLTDAGMQALRTNADIAKWVNATDNLVEKLVNGQYSQDQETRSDLLAVDYLIAAGYDPRGYHNFIQRMATASSSGGDLMSTHPGLGDRANRVAGKINQKGNFGGATLADRFRKNVPRPTA